MLPCPNPERGKRGLKEQQMNLNELKKKKIGELTEVARELKVEGASGMMKQELNRLGGYPES